MSDSCGEQNKNISIIQFSLWIARTFNVTVTHLFPVQGYSYNVYTRNFGSYMRKLRKMENIYTAKEYIKIVKTVRKKKPFPIKSETGNLS